MERLQDINISRIAWCCNDYGISPDELANEVGISHASMNGLMKGERGLTFGQLSKIAQFFGRGVLFFLQPGDVEANVVHTLAFRTLANQKPELSTKIRSLIERVEHQRTIYSALRDETDDLPTFNPIDVPSDDPIKAACLVRQWLGLPTRNSFETYRSAIEAKGILVFLSNGYQGKWQIAKESPVMGFTLYDDECPVIVIKKQRWESQQTFTLIHELGHLILQKMSSIDDEGDFYSHEGEEKIANAFAGHLLVPKERLNDIDLQGRPRRVDEFDGWLERHRKMWGVSTEVILRRLLDSGKIERHEYAEYRLWRANVAEQLRDGGNREWRHREPKHIFGDTFVRAVLDAMQSKSITLSKACTYLDGLKVSDLHKLESYYASL
jgi:Zn-dependent peptidase ImmA (M78 family)/transcriptional regulator with XRE-family HTH domain